MATYYLAVDIGASSGRHILGTYGKRKNGSWKKSIVLRTVWLRKTENSAGSLTAFSTRS